MSRLDDFTSFDNAQFEDVDCIVEATGKTASLYRPVITGSAGFDTEIGEEELIARILVHLAKKTGGPTRAKAAGGVSVSKTKYVGLTVSEDVRIGDILKIESKRYRIVDIDKGNKGKSEMDLEKIE